MSPEIESHLDFPEKEELASIGKEYNERIEKRKELRRDKKAQEQNEARIKVLREEFVGYFTGALLDNPDQAREIVDFATGVWDNSAELITTDYRGKIFGSLMETQIDNGLYEPKEYEKPVNRDYSDALKFIERRMKIVQALIDNNFDEFKPYYDYMRDARCKLKVSKMTFWMRTEHEDRFLYVLDTKLNKGEFWNDLLVYTTQKTPNEIGGIERVVGENRIPNESVSDPTDKWESIRSGRQITEEVQAESFKYDLYVMSFIALLEEDLKITSNNMHHLHQMGEFSRYRNTKELCREAQNMCGPTIEKHNLEVAEKVRAVFDSNGRVLIPEPDPQTFKKQLEAIMQIFPHYKVEDKIDDKEMPEKTSEEDRIENCMDLRDSEFRISTDYTPFEGMDVEWDYSSEE